MQLCQWNEFHADLLGGLPTYGAIRTEAGRQEDIILFTTAAATAHKVPEVGQRLGTIPRLFFEFPSCCGLWRLAVQSTRRTLEECPLHRVAIDVLHDHPPISEHRHDDHKAGVLHHGVGDCLAGGE